MSSSSDDELPPLEDLSSHFVKKPVPQGGFLDGQDRSGISFFTVPGSEGPEPPKNTRTEAKKEIDKPVQAKKKSNESFGGFKKGFMFGGPPKKTTKPAKKKAPAKKPAQNKDDDQIEEIIRPKKPEENTLKFDDVTKNMASTIENSKDEWLNDDLLSTVESDQSLVKQLQDPEVSKALEWMQKDPQAAYAHYQKHDPEKLEMFRKFTQILGSHMSNVQTKKADTESRVDQKNKILEKPKIKELVHYLKTNPDRAQYLIHSNKDEEFREDVRVLLASGDLKLNA